MRTYLIHFLICIICNQNTQRTRLGRCCSFEAPPSSDPNPPRRPLKVTDISSILSSRQFAVVGLVVAGIVVCKRQRTQFSNSHACSQHSGNPCLYPFSSFSFFPFPAFPSSDIVVWRGFSRCIVSFACQQQSANFCHIGIWGAILQGFKVTESYNEFITNKLKI